MTLQFLFKYFIFEFLFKVFYPYFLFNDCIRRKIQMSQTYILFYKDFDCIDKYLKFPHRQGIHATYKVYTWIVTKL